MSAKINIEGNSRADLMMLKQIHEEVVSKHRGIVDAHTFEVKRIEWELKHFPRKYPIKTKEVKHEAQRNRGKKNRADQSVKIL